MSRSRSRSNRNKNILMLSNSYQFIRRMNKVKRGRIIKIIKWRLINNIIIGMNKIIRDIIKIIG